MHIDGKTFIGLMVYDESYIKECNTYEELIKDVDEYMDYYNYYRSLWNLKKMTPVKYRNHLQMVV